jgi:class 3 adenylate cyclase
MAIALAGQKRDPARKTRRETGGHRFSTSGRGLRQTMSEDRVERRLAAILAVDVAAGYSRLMGVDEQSTLATLKSIRRELTDPKVKEHRGRIGSSE